jgi:hypothetical protein
MAALVELGALERQVARQIAQIAPEPVQHRCGCLIHLAATTAPGRRRHGTL